MKILMIEVGNIKFIDSLSILHLPLSKLPKDFGIQDQIKKGYFPFKFNSMNNWGYKGRLPSPEDYGVEYMKPDDAKEFTRWYQENKEIHFDFRKEIVDYCENDVKILTQSIMEFRKLFKSLTQIDPITSCFTLASIGMLVFRRLHLPKVTMGITLNKVYGTSRRYSKSCAVWLDMEENKTEGRIQRKALIGIYRSDGYRENDNYVFEFFGCYYHGCKCIFKENRDVPIPEFEKSPNELFDYAKKKRQL